VRFLKNFVNYWLSLIGIQFIKVGTLRQLQSSQKVVEELDWYEAHNTEEKFKRNIFERSKEEMARNSEAHDFRLIAKLDEPSISIPQTYLHTLIRESLALRDQSGEIARLNRELSLFKKNSVSPVHDDKKLEGVVDKARQDEIYTPVYDFDGLKNDPGIIHNHDFMRNERFVHAYLRASGFSGVEYQNYYWRVHVAIWCASLGLSLEGDFVECGVYKGLLSTAIMSYFDWNSTGRDFYLFDTFEGVDERQLSDDEIKKGTIAYFREMYKEDIYQDVVRNFSEFSNVQIIKGIVPYSLETVDIKKVAYLSIDMNNALPEIAAVNYFWDRLSPGAPILLDDYGFINYECQKRAFDNWAKEHSIEILALPTGQGLIIKPGVFTTLKK